MYPFEGGIKWCSLILIDKCIFFLIILICIFIYMFNLHNCIVEIIKIVIKA